MDPERLSDRVKKVFSEIRQYVHQTDKLLLFFCLLASAYGVALIYSATYSYHTAQYVDTQVMAIALGVVGYLAAAAFDTRSLARFYIPLFACNLLLLGSLYFWGVGEGNRSWIRFGGIGVQPAEIGKIVFVISFAGHLAASREKGMRVRDVAALVAHAGVVCLFVICFSSESRCFCCGFIVPVGSAPVTESADSERFPAKTAGFPQNSFQGNTFSGRGTVS